MIKEWSSPFNPFNSLKILLWRKYLEACVKGEYLIPPMVDIDLSQRCNFDCPHCNAYDIIGSKFEDLPTEHFLRLADFLRDWRLPNKEEKVLSCCVSGGGESLVHPGAMEILQRLSDNGIEVGLITNGSLVNSKEKIETIARTCKWVGFSMDAATPVTFSIIKGIKTNIFGKVCANLAQLAQKYKELGLVNGTCFKFLLSPINYKEIYTAACLAKTLGVHDFHLRPVSYLNVTKVKDKQLIYTEEMLQEINEQIEKAQKLETEDFKVYGVRHKFAPNFQPIKKFKKCWTIPMLPTFGADGNVHMCFDMRNRPDFIMCKHFELEKFWNSEKHKKMVNAIDISTCTRCTFSQYNEAVEKVFIEDNMFRNFL